jgi:hypothetical protein
MAAYEFPDFFDSIFKMFLPFYNSCVSLGTFDYIYNLMGTNISFIDW